MIAYKRIKKQTLLIAGVDEVGRGPLAGPVLASAVILDPMRPIPGIKDSKQLTEKQREKLFPLIQENVLACGIGRAEVEEIDGLNILQATLLAMQRAIEQLSIAPEHIFVDGIHLPKISLPMTAVIKGDQTIPEISAASIVAKVTRDREMRIMDAKYPGYGFAKHKGYGTPEHLKNLQILGPTEIHRKSFMPVKSLV